jgi:undecaprenyl-diphosphatase
MTFIHAIILSIIEGLTEFLPISSTGHLILGARVLGLDQDAFAKTFEIAIQLGAILAVVVLYWRRFLMEWATLKKIIVAFIPTAVVGLLLYKTIKDVFFENPAVVLWALLAGGVFLILFERWHKEADTDTADISAMTYKQSFLIGLAQSVAVIPGVSRAAATILGGLSLKLKRAVIVEFSFLLAVPTMAAATGLDLLKTAPDFAGREFALLAVGFIGSFVMAILAIKFMLRFIRQHKFTGFGIYRIILALVFWFIVRP